MVSLRGPSTNYFWEGLERFDAKLEELDIGYDEVDYINN